jgi:DNA polymerase-3 subunit epsilon
MIRRVGGLRLGPDRGTTRKTWRAGRFAAIDLELTGLDPARDRIVSFGIVPVVDAAARLDEATYREVASEVLARPEAVAIHRLRPADLAGAPAFAQVRNTLRAALDGAVPLAWAAFVEAAFLASELGGRERAWLRRICDVRPLAMHLDHLEGIDPSPAANASLAATAERFGVPRDDEHHALGDAFMTAQLFLVVASHLERHGPMTVGGVLATGRSR